MKQGLELLPPPYSPSNSTQAYPREATVVNPCSFNQLRIDKDSLEAVLVMFACPSSDSTNWMNWVAYELMDRAVRHRLAAVGIMNCSTELRIDGDYEDPFNVPQDNKTQTKEKEENVNKTRRLGKKTPSGAIASRTSLACWSRFSYGSDSGRKFNPGAGRGFLQVFLWQHFNGYAPIPATVNVVQDYLSDFDMSGMPISLCCRWYYKIVLFKILRWLGSNKIKEVPVVDKNGDKYIYYRPFRVHRQFGLTKTMPFVVDVEAEKNVSQASQGSIAVFLFISSMVIKRIVVGNVPSIKAPADKAQSSPAVKGKCAPASSSSSAPKIKKAHSNISEKSKSGRIANLANANSSKLRALDEVSGSNKATTQDGSDIFSDPNNRSASQDDDGMDNATSGEDSSDASVSPSQNVGYADGATFGGSVQ
ncbi:hypothetical protein TIFTF001_040103 [Ficus carica]|uniref:Uncharacterized protein n=1 Tax=Ficus carica TaxID=3494 RepID=A0AA87Z572_FICCA|nr:hypothetical protein TIFTF001_040103 [Ficus carica]